MIPRWYLSPEGLAVIRARAAAMRDYLRIRREVRALRDAARRAAR